MLASIPEAHSSMSSTHGSRSLHGRAASSERTRPRSRVLHVSRRPARVRNPPQVPSRLRQAYYEDASPPPNPNSATQQAHCPSKPLRSRDLSNSACPVEPPVDSSLSSVDLDSFPLPPGGNLPLKQAPSNSYPIAELQTGSPSPLAAGTTTPVAPRYQGSVTRRFVDAATDASRGPKHASIDSALIEAISRTVAQQLRLFMSVKRNHRSFGNPQKPPKGAPDYQSRSSCHVESLDRFTRDLHQYADDARVAGKVIHSTPTPTAKSGETLDTVSALLPFRTEFRAAGLAVTSQDQAQYQASFSTKAAPICKSQQGPSVPSYNHGQHSQLDGPQGAGASSSATTKTEISFVHPQDMDEWRYALIDEAPVRKQKRAPKKKAKSHCLPCFPAEDGHATDTEWAHFKPLQGAQPPPRPPPPPPHTTITAPIHGVSPPSSRHAAPLGAEPRRTKPSETPSPRHRKIKVAAPTRDKADKLRHQGTESRGQKFSISLPRHKFRGDGTRHDNSHKQTETIGSQYGFAPVTHSVKLVPDELRPFRNTTKLSQSARSLRPANGSSVGKGRAPLPKTYSAMAVEPCRSHVPSALPSTWGRQDGPMTNLEEELEKTARLVADRKPLSCGKGPSSSVRRRRRGTSRYDANHIGICCRSSRGVPSRANAPPNIPKRSSSMRDSISSKGDDLDDAEILDRDVLRGLHVAASAACDDEVDAFVRDKTGLRIRRFLADLMTLEAFGQAKIAQDGEKRGRQRRSDMRKLKQQVRRSREIAMAGGLI
ncbi:hypothetical protein CDD82_2862 [Ophiocordyceps australis]|uniref:Uncharacterized protein n=1 Tax=Ophiocordyceps australis TaxID=1399860 RepID=A0A2C5ZCM7_9HYPO|nr:hypothetical protein CDD82_2862 [Ophiocordyceps australis]